MKQNFVRFFSSDDVLRGKVKNILKAEPMCINHTVRTFVENRSTLATSCSLKPAVPKYIFPDFDTLGLALLRNSSQDARYLQIFDHWKIDIVRFNFIIGRSLGSILKTCQFSFKSDLQTFDLVE